MPMTVHSKEILRAASHAHIALTPLSVDQQSQFWSGLQSRFDLDLNAPLWNQMKFSINESDPDGWQRLPGFFSHWPNLFFCDHYRGVPVYRFDRKEDLLTLLGESFHFVFYIASPDFAQIGVFDDHECLRFTPDTDGTASTLASKR